MPVIRLISVMPIWIAERSVVGSSISASADFAPGLALLGGRLQPGALGRNQRHLRQREEAVEQDQQQDDEDFAAEHGARRPAGPDADAAVYLAGCAVIPMQRRVSHSMAPDIASRRIGPGAPVYNAPLFSGRLQLGYLSGDSRWIG